jgi:hypothetical protein
MSSLEAPIPVKATRRTTRGLHATWPTGPKPAFPRKPFRTPHGSNLSMGLCWGLVLKCYDFQILNLLI